MTRGVIDGLVFVDENGNKRAGILGAVNSIADLVTSFTSAEEGDFALVKVGTDGRPSIFSFNGSVWSTTSGDPADSLGQTQIERLELAGGEIILDTLSIIGD